MAPAAIRHFIKEISTIRPSKGVFVTGGEPFQERALLEIAVREAGAFGLSTNVVSNGYWGDVSDSARDYLVKLKSNGLHGISFSLDAAHESFIPVESVRFAASLCQRLGLLVGIKTSFAKGPPEKRKEEAIRLLGIPPSEQVVYTGGYIIPNGRASRKIDSSELSFFSPDSKDGTHLKDRCHFVLNNPIITATGDVSMCCSPSATARDGFNENYLIGNVFRKPLTNILADASRKLWINILAKSGPHALWSLVDEIDPSVFSRKKFVNICDLCANVLTNSRAMAALEKSFQSVPLGENLVL